METRQARQDLKDRMVQTKLDLKHTENCRLLPDRTVMLDLMKKQAVVAEIGVAFGGFSKKILARCNPSKFHLVDAWSTERYKAGLNLIKTELNAQIVTNLVEIHHGLSTDVLPLLEDGSLDWVYIDTNHSFETTLLELELSLQKVKPDGRIAGHDFCTGNVIKPVPYGVVEAVTKFCKDRDWQFEFLTVESFGHFSFCLRRIE